MKTTVKRVTALLLTSMTAVTLNACGSKQPAAKKAASTAAASSEGTEVKMTLFTLTYSDDWTINEDNQSDSESYSNLELLIPQKDGDPLVEVDVSAETGKPDSYREKLKSGRIDAYELVENKSVNTVNVGGIACVEYEYASWYEESLHYLGRDEASGTTVEITVYGDTEDPRIEDLIKSVKYTLTDTGNEDAPWPWQGEPFTTDAQHTVAVGSHSVTADFIRLDDPLIASDIFSGRVEVIGDTVWVLLDNTLYQYQYSNGALIYVNEQSLGTEGTNYEELSSDTNGKLYVSGFGEQMLIMENGEVKGRIEDLDRAVIHPGGTWGITSFFGQPLQKITLDGATASLEEWALRPGDETSNGFISQNHVFVTGTSNDKENTAVWVFDSDGSQQFEFGNTDFAEGNSMGSINDVIETANGYIILDGNMRCLFFYGADGTLLGTADDGDLFGTSYPWISSASLMSDGSVLIAMTEERADESADELLLYRLSGF